MLAALKREGQAILIVDNDLEALNGLADRHYVLQKGRVVWHGAPDELRKGVDLQAGVCCRFEFAFFIPPACGASQCVGASFVARVKWPHSIQPRRI